MKFAIINDIHHGPSDSGFKNGIQRKLTYEAERLVNEFVQKMNTLEYPEFVVSLGDFIEDVNNKETDIQYFQKTIKMLSHLDMPMYSLIGNHDIRTLTGQDIAKMLNYEHMYYSFDASGYHFVALSFEMTGDHTHVMSDIRAEVPAAQLEWLQKDLAQTDKSTIIFIHYGLAEDDMKGNFWFESEPHYALLSNRIEVRNILEQSGKVKAVISGHQHWNRMNVHNNIPYFIVTSITENFRNDGTPTEAHTIVTLNEEKIVVDVKGNDPVFFQYSFK
jgi:3',5'-cyclic AMP phosphodiesterase CpdA